MSTKQEMYFCKTCQKPTLHLENKPNHVLHLLLSVLTAGSWIIVWVLVSMGTGNARCTVCGTRAKYRLFLGYRRS